MRTPAGRPTDAPRNAGGRTRGSGTGAALLAAMLLTGASASALHHWQDDIRGHTEVLFDWIEQQLN